MKLLQLQFVQHEQHTFRQHLHQKRIIYIMPSAVTPRELESTSFIIHVMLSAVKPWKSWKVHHISYTSCCQLYNHGRAGKCIIYHTRHAVRCKTTEELESTSFIIHVMLSAVKPRKSWKVHHISYTSCRPL